MANNKVAHASATDSEQRGCQVEAIGDRNESATGDVRRFNINLPTGPEGLLQVGLGFSIQDRIEAASCLFEAVIEIGIGATGDGMHGSMGWGVAHLTAIGKSLVDSIAFDEAHRHEPTRLA